MAVSFGNGLELVNFRVYEKTASGKWKHVIVGEGNKKYRYRLYFKNVNTARVTPPFTQQHSHLELYSVMLTNAGYAKFYTNSSYTSDTSSTGYSSPRTNRISQGKSKYIYSCFIWKTPNNSARFFSPVTISIKLTSAVFKKSSPRAVPQFG